MTKLSKFDAAEYLTDVESQKLYLEEVSKENNPQQFIKALETVARAKLIAIGYGAPLVPERSAGMSVSEGRKFSFENLL